MKSQIVYLALLVVALVFDSSSHDSAQAADRFVPPAVKDPDATIRKQMTEQWKSPQRLLWKIVYHPIRGMQSKSDWHIQETDFWVRLNPGVYKLDELDKTKVYQIDAVALDQNYGVIDFYIYHHPAVEK